MGKRQVVIYGFEYAFATAITGVVDLFSMAGVSWNRIHGEPVERRFKPIIATLDGEPVRCVNGLQISAHASIHDIDQTDLLLIPTISGNIAMTLDKNQEVLPWLRKHYNQGADIASNCTGAFLLAEAGLLNGRQATTHWGFIDLFRERYPQVLLRPEQLITSDGSIFCSGGGMAWLDLTLFLIERYCGHEVAMGCAKSYVIDMERGSQKAYSTIQGKKYHRDDSILAIQEWMEKNYAESINLESVAIQFNMSPRTFKRRFKQATGETPIYYLQSLRIESAKKQLETTRAPVENVTQSVGYEDVSSFTRLFKKHTGLSPSAYRSRFNRR